MKRTTLILAALFAFTLLSYGQIGFENYVINDESTDSFNPRDLIAGDIDGDGDLDILVGYYDRIVWYENLDGMGMFGVQRHINLDIDIMQAVALADLDGDGDLDAISGSSGDDKIAWYENLDGLGNFGLEEIVSNSVLDSRDITTGDLDADGDVDIISASWDDTEVVWFANNGSGIFSSALTISSIAFQARSVDVSDIDGDGDFDVVIGARFKTTWHENNGTGSFGPEQLIDDFDQSDFVMEGDLDSDGDIDIIAARPDNNELSWFENLDGNGGFSAEQVITGGLNNIRESYVADIDGDGDLDIVTAVWSQNEVSWYENLDGLANFGPKQIIDTTGRIPEAVIVEDLDGDLDLDVVSVSGDSEVGWMENLNGLGTFGRKRLISRPTGPPNDFSVDDLDGDGDLDLIVCGSDKVSWYPKINGAGNFGLQSYVVNELNDVSAVASADLDGDSDIDLIYGTRGDEVLGWSENLDGLGNFGPIRLIDSLEDSISIKPADMDNDGDFDLVVLAVDAITLSWFENEDGLGNFGARQEIQTQGSAHAFMDVADLDMDGDLDIVSTSSGAAYVYENTDGLGTISPWINISDFGLSIRSMDTEDFDLDGDIDVIIDSGLFGVLWFENNGPIGDFQNPQALIETSVGLDTMYVTDLDNDGDFDILGRSEDTEQIVYYERLDGSGLFGNVEVITDLGLAISLFLTDLNQDDKPDFILGTQFPNAINYFENLGVLGNTIFGSVSFDQNGNGCSSGASSVANILVEADNGINSFSAYTDASGSYSINTNEGTFLTEIASPLPVYIESNPESYEIIFVGDGNSEEANFCLEPTQVADDLNIALYPRADARPGFQSNYELTFSNIGTSSMTGSISLTFDNSRVSFVEASEAVASQSANSLTFDYADLNVLETRRISITFELAPPPTNQSDDILIYTAEISPVAGDITPEDNEFELEQIVVNSFDPNDILVLEGETIFEEETNDYLHYIIRFQNTGTADAINVRVENELDSNLDWSTLQPEALSHPNRIEIRDGNLVEFIFDNINLPPQSQSEEDSQGFIAYKIKPISSIGLGDSMSNNADIFFDFNAPIRTNTVTTTVIERLGVDEVGLTNLALYPVPSSDAVQIASDQKITRLDLFNELGQTIRLMEDADGIQEFSVAELSNGIYFVRLFDEAGAMTIKKVVKN